MNQKTPKVNEFIRNTHVIKGKPKPQNKAKCLYTELDAEQVIKRIRAFWCKWYTNYSKMKAVFLIKSAVTLVWKLMFPMKLTFLSYLKNLLYKHWGFGNIKDLSCMIKRTDLTNPYLAVMRKSELIWHAVTEAQSSRELYFDRELKV